MSSNKAGENKGLTTTEESQSFLLRMGQLKTMSLVTTAVFYFAEKWLITDWSWDSDFFFVLHYSKGEVTYWSCVCLYIWIIQGNYFPCWC